MEKMYLEFQREIQNVTEISIQTLKKKRKKKVNIKDFNSDFKGSHSNFRTFCSNFSSGL